MKTKIGKQNILYPMPVTLIGAQVKELPNFIIIAHVGILNATTPHLISVGINKIHYTNAGIIENKTFSVNIPTEEMIVETDYIGMVSGRDVDKSQLFEIFYGELKTAPMITRCPLCMECRLYDTYTTHNYDLFIGEVVATYADERVMSDKRVDLAKVKPLLFDMSSRKYWSVGAPLADAWKVGKTLKDQLPPKKS
jgi:flavin reductase (DIM6/NTAB) family NADH-FMN oxidoreductase RutF